MAANPLLDPGNRTLGIQTSEFGLYGGQPSVVADVGRASDGNGATVGPPTAPTEPMPADEQTADRQLIDGQETGIAGAVASPPQQHTDHVAPVAIASAAAPPDIALSVPAPIGSSATPVFQPINIHDLALTGSTADGSVDHVASGATTALSAPLFGDSLVVNGLVTSLLSHATEAVQDVGTTLGDVAGELAPLTGATLGLIETLGADAHAGLDSLTGSIDHVIGQTDAAVSEVFAGADPVGGITTLVGLVASEEGHVFGPAVADNSVVSAGTSIVDALASDVADSPLVGDAAHDHHDGVLDLHHGLGLG